MLYGVIWTQFELGFSSFFDDFSKWSAAETVLCNFEKLSKMVRKLEGKDGSIHLGQFVFDPFFGFSLPIKIYNICINRIEKNC